MYVWAHVIFNPKATVVIHDCWQGKVARGKKGKRRKRREREESSDEGGGWPEDGRGLKGRRGELAGETGQQRGEVENGKA